MSRKMTQVGVAWRKKTQDGKEFLSVVITNPMGPDLRLSIWSNSYKEKDGQPDYIIYKPADQRPAVAAQPSGEFPADDGAEDGEVPF